MDSRDERVPKRVWDKLVEMPSGCWEWVGRRSKLGYGEMWYRTGKQLTHRVVYLLYAGSIPTGKDIDHLCRNRACANPAHLEAVTHLENTRRGDGGLHNKAKIQCPAGHSYSEDNTYTNPKGQRICRSCQRRHDLNHRTK